MELIYNIKCLTLNRYQALRNVGWGSEIQKKPIPDPDPWVKKASDPEPRIRITAFIIG